MEIVNHEPLPRGSLLFAMWEKRLRGHYRCVFVVLRGRGYLLDIKKSSPLSTSGIANFFSLSSKADYDLTIDGGERIYSMKTGVKTEVSLGGEVAYITLDSEDQTKWFKIEIKYLRKKFTLSVQDGFAASPLATFLWGYNAPYKHIRRDNSDGLRSAIFFEDATHGD